MPMGRPDPRAEAPGRESDTTALVAVAAAEPASPLRADWADASSVAAGLAAALALLIAAAACALAVSMRRQPSLPELAERESDNGDTLLWLAREIERHVAQSEQAGRNAGEQRRWARLCRRIAGEHLECVNALMLEGLRREAPSPSRRKAAEP
ncbi:hypothetical protein [Lysobacter sp. Root604]|uniref:hypothetical protein n=1 Tax=Lysobacter sp. Root604 TaxID=1736568 RepID=UPI0006F2DCC7|nr:hypothetical protein [Lysobacter sp. Root604]KRA20851.1 hypothetical protein ASD69_05980 [Lysobacter sp. Root604]